MEEGPEPQELMENVDHSVEQKRETGEHRSKHLRPAVTAAILAVGAAIGSLLSGHAANEAILLQSQASDQWSYYQAKSTKLHLYELNKTLLQSIIDVGKVEDPDQTDASKSKRVNAIIDRFGAKTGVYEQEKKQIEEEARKLEDESKHAFKKHQVLSFAVACFQIGIVVASVSILIDGAPFLYASFVVGLIGVALVLYGAVM